MRPGVFLPSVVLLLLAEACVSKGYVARSLADEGDVDPRATRALGCIDVGLSVRGPADAPILRAKLGNGCMEPALVDFTRAVVLARFEDGGERPLAFDDPRAEIVPLHLDARRKAVEAFRLVGADQPIARLCVDVRGVAWSETPAPPICFSPGAAVRWEVAP